MLNHLKKIKHSLNAKREIKLAYRNDCLEFEKWQYNNPAVKTKNALEAKILRQTHVIEKGMSLSHPKEKFGVQKVNELLGFISDFINQGYKIEDSISVKNAPGVVAAYLQFHKEKGFEPVDIVKNLSISRNIL